MAPKYAPRLRGSLPSLVLPLQLTFILLYLFYVRFEKPGKEAPFTYTYAEFQDVNVMVFCGFGFLGAFLCRYGFSSTAFSLLVSSFSLQLAVLLNGLFFSYHQGTILVTMRSLAEAQLCAASSLIAMGALLGKLNPIQLLLMALVEVSGFIVSRFILKELLSVQMTDSIRMLFIFGATFGVTASWVHRPGPDPYHDKEKFDRKTGLLSLLGALFLWLFWPSFNSILTSRHNPTLKMSALYSTYVSLATSAVSAFAISMATNPRGKISVEHIQGALLAGGAAMGVSVTAVRAPWVAMTIGLCAGTLSLLGLRYLKPHLQQRYGCHDTCGVLSVHGLPGLLGWMAHMIIQMSGRHTAVLRFAVFHLCSLLITLSISLALGALTGFLLRWRFWKPPQERKYFDDQAFWEFPHLAVHK